MKYTVDIGNTLLKIGVFENEELKCSYKFQTENIGTEEFVSFISKIKEDFKGSFPGILSTVVDIPTINLDALNKLGPYRVFDNSYKLNYTNHYQSPRTLGLDRMAGIAAAASIFPNQNSLVLMAGTCITYDFINSENEFLGGIISPGKLIRAKSLHTFTSKLPFINPNIDMEINYLGRNTEECLQSGIIWGMIHEIEGFLKQFSNHYSYFNIILSGGDANFLDTPMKNTIFAHQIKWMPDLVLIGLNQILKIQDA